MKTLTAPVVCVLATVLLAPLAITKSGCRRAADDYEPNDGSLQSVALLRHRDGLLGWVNSIDWSNDGKYIATGGSGGTVRIWDVATWEMIRELRQPEEDVRTVAFGPRSDMLLSAGDVDSGSTCVRIWDLGSGNLRGSFRQHSSDVIFCAVVSPDGTTAASGGHDEVIRIWPVDLSVPGVQITGHRSSVNDLAYSSDGGRIASSSSDKSVRMWDVASGTELWRGDHARPAVSVAISPDDQFVASGETAFDVYLWNADDGARLQVWSGHEGSVHDLAFSATHRLLISCDAFGTTLIRAVPDGKEIARITRFPCYGIAISPDGKQFALAAADGTIRIWRMPLDAEGVTTWHAIDEQVPEQSGSAKN